jgi:ATP-dependent DNA ligase
MIKEFKGKNLYQGCAGEIRPHNIKEFSFGKGYIVEEKYDGIWINISFDNEGKVRLISRTMKEKNNAQLESLRVYCEEKFDLRNSNIVGELAFGTQKGTEYAQRVGHHKIDVFDVLGLEGNSLLKDDIKKRKAMLRGLIINKGIDASWINLAPFDVVDKASVVQKMYDKIVANGGEGLIVKDPMDKDYRFGKKSPVWFKIKKEVSMDYIIMGYSETESDDFKSRGWIGGIECGLLENGVLTKKVTVGSMDFEHRDKFSKNKQKFLGKVVEVGGFEIFKSGSMRHPYLVRIRLKDDKKAEDCIWG